MSTNGVKQGASSNRFVLGYKTEADWGVTPVGNYSAMRITSESLGVDEATTQSAELREDRQTSDIVRTQYDATGSVDIEWSRDTFDPMIESALEGAFSTKVDVTTTLSFVSTTKAITDDDVSGAFADVSVGDVIRIGGTASNDGIYVVATNADDNTITVEETLTDETGTGDETVEGASARNGIAQCSFSLVGGPTDADVFKEMTGMVADTMSLEAGVGEIVTGSFEFMGKDVTFSETEPTVDDAPATRVFNSVQNFSGFAVNGTSVAAITSASLETTNNSEMQRILGQLASYGIRDGRFEATGSITLHLEDKTYLDYFRDETEISVRFSLIDNTGYGLVFFMPRVRLSNAEFTAGGENEDILQTFDYTALADATYGYTVQVTRFTDV